MKSLGFIIAVTFYFAVISEVALSLGITTSILEKPNSPTIIQDPNFLETLQNIYNTAVENIGSFIQIITFTTSLPDIINTIFFLPPAMGGLFVVLSLLRGTS